MNNLLQHSAYKYHDSSNKNKRVMHINEMKKLTTERQSGFIFERGERTYNASIEDKRIKLIERTIKAGLTKTKSESE